MVRRRITRPSVENGRVSAPYVSRTPSRTNVTPVCNNEGESGKILGEAFTNKIWRVYRVTPMQKFSYANKKFQEYSEKLASSLEMGQAKNCGVCVGHHKKYRVNFSIVRGVARSKADSDAVEISISSLISGSDKNVFTGILLSVNYSEREHSYIGPRRSHINLPLFLATGQVMIMKSVFNFLQDNFLCHIREISFSSYDLMWMLSLCCGHQSADSVKPCMLQYSLPYSDLQTIEYTISSSSLTDVWTKIHDVNASITHADVSAFIKCLEKHFFTIFSIELANFHLQCIGTPVASVHRKGSVKVYESRDVFFVLQQLARLSEQPSIH